MNETPTHDKADEIAEQAIAFGNREVTTKRSKKVGEPLIIKGLDPVTPEVIEEDEVEMGVETEESVATQVLDHFAKASLFRRYMKQDLTDLMHGTGPNQLPGFMKDLIGTLNRPKAEETMRVPHRYQAAKTLTHFDRYIEECESFLDSVDDGCSCAVLDAFTERLTEWRDDIAGAWEVVYPTDEVIFSD
jgi:hypothetical protein